VFQAKIQKVNKYSSNDSYKAKWDMVVGSSLTSIKSIRQKGAVELGSLLRFYENIEPFTLTVGWHSNSTIYGIQEVLVDKQALQLLKGTISVDEIRKACDTLTIANFPLGKHKEARAYFKQWKKDNKEKLGLATPTGKVDSLSQRRWQCNINNNAWNKLFSSFPLLTRYKGFDLEWFN
jgi:hypothetical protein